MKALFLKLVDLVLGKVALDCFIDQFSRVAVNKRARAMKLLKLVQKNCAIVHCRNEKLCIYALVKCTYMCKHHFNRLPPREPLEGRRVSQWRTEPIKREVNRAFEVTSRRPERGKQTAHLPSRASWRPQFFRFANKTRRQTAFQRLYFKLSCSE